jgi:hypothetical protein
MKPKTPSHLVLISLLAVSALAAAVLQGRTTGQSSNAQAGIPRFEVDRSWQWPPKLPNNWVVGIVSFVAVDRQDNVWVLHRPRQVVGQTDHAAPAVLQFDAAGKFVQAWGGPSPGYDWPDMEHGLSVDYQDNVWITGLNPLERSYQSRHSGPTT